MSSYKQRGNKLAGMKGLLSFLLIGLIIGVMVYCMYMAQVKRQESKVVTDPIILTNPGGVVQQEVDEETMEEIDEDTGLKSIFDKVTGKIVDSEADGD